jgi:hypothetical protein
MYFLVSCSDPEGLGKIITTLHTVLTLIQIGIPIGLILIGTIDLGRAVLAGDEKEIKQHQTTLFKRAIAAIVVFFITAIVTFATGLVGGTAWQDCWNATQHSSTKIDTAKTEKACTDAKGVWDDGVCYKK